MHVLSCNLLPNLIYNRRNRRKALDLPQRVVIEAVQDPGIFVLHAPEIVSPWM